MPGGILGAGRKDHDHLMPAEETLVDLRRQVRELTEENMRLAEKVAARDSFLAIAAHELRNPITPIVSRIALLRNAVAKGNLPPEKLVHNLEQIDWLIALFVKRATILLDVSRITTGKLRLELDEVDVCEVAHAVAINFEPLAQNAGSPITLDLPSGGLAVVGDWLAIEEVLDNLLSNAIKYGAGKPILMRAVGDPANGVARLSVADGGSGISAESQARIFERFERAVPPANHSGGFGVGLWIVKQLVEAMKGTIIVTCPPGEGSTFFITLPLMPAKESE
jgi:signal transduction histidine kinase